MQNQPDMRGLGDEIFGRREETPERSHPVRTLTANGAPNRVLMLPTESIRPNPDQPRKYFDEAALAELTNSVRDKGILQPILVRPEPAAEGVIIIAGERRWRAAKAAGLAEIPVLLRDTGDDQEIALIENLQRENLAPLEEAEALRALKVGKGYTDEQLAAVIGKSRSSITETLSLTKLPAEIIEECRALDNPEIASRIKLLQLVRMESPEERSRVWELMKRGEATTLRQIQETTKKTSSRTKGRPKLFTFKKKTSDYELVLRLKKGSDRSGVRGALEHALQSLE